MNKILGLDLGSSSIGWAFIEENGSKSKISKLGVRVIPFSGDEIDQFIKGQAISVNKDRTLKRTARKTNHRYKLRRQALDTFLKQNGISPDAKQMLGLDPMALFELRANAATRQVTLQELGRVLFLLNQKRGYKSSRSSSNEEDGSGKKLSDYLSEMNDRKSFIAERHITIGQYFYSKLSEDRNFRVRQNVFPRECYIAEFEQIWSTQQAHYPDLLTDEKRKVVRDQIIFYQRRLKSQKQLVGKCQFELHHRVAPKSSPLFQVEKIWESINTISLTNKKKELFNVTKEQKDEIFTHLDCNIKLTQTELFKILKIKRTDGWYPNEQIAKAGIQGNITKATLIKAFADMGIDRSDLLKFDLIEEDAFDHQSGEVRNYKIINGSFEKEPLYRLWHLLYSVDDPEQLIKVLMKDFSFTREQAQSLNKIDFKKQGFGSKSARAIRKLLPSLRAGADYSQSAAIAGYNHSNSITKAENEQRELQSSLERYKRNTLRQPVVEKVLNQLVNLVNLIITQEELGRPDEIRIELARELRQSQQERNDAYNNTIKRNREHEAIKDRISADYPGLKITNKLIEKYKLYEQQAGICIYSGKKMELSSVLRGEGVDVDHIIPQSRLFDDSFQNKVLAFRKENEAKDNDTAYDYMKGKSDDVFRQYLERVDQLFTDKIITRSKRNKLMMAANEIPADFINRQLNETRFISKEATKLLKKICRNVYVSTGSVTEFLREQWGYNDILKQLNWHKYEQAGLVAENKIQKWKKRDDHRHHAIDALVVATTSQSIIHRLNNLNASATRQEMLATVKDSAPSGWQAKRSLLEQHVQGLQPFTVAEAKEAVSKILVSQKAGKKVASTSKNKFKNKARVKGQPIYQETLTPRGQLHKEQVYGRVLKYASAKTPLNSRFDQVDKIANPAEKTLVEERLARFSGDPKKAFKDLKKDPIWLDEAKQRALESVTLWEEQFVYKYSLGIGFNEKDVDSIVDVKVRELVRARFNERKGSKDHPLKDLENDPIWLNKGKGLRIKSVRCFTGLRSLVPLHVAQNGVTMSADKESTNSKPVDYVNERNNHHLAIYKDEAGGYHSIIVSLMEAVKRKNYQLPVIITEPGKAWEKVDELKILDTSILDNLPLKEWQFVTSLQQNELFCFNLTDFEYKEALNQKNIGHISQNLFRVQKMSQNEAGTIDVYFRHHLETRVDDVKMGGEALVKKIGKLLRITSLNNFVNNMPVKIKLDAAGYIS